MTSSADAYEDAVSRQDVFSPGPTDATASAGFRLWFRLEPERVCLSAVSAGLAAGESF